MLTDRLDLQAANAATDLDGLHALLSDPAQWAHAPAARHRDRDTTRSWIARAAARWESDGLSYWTVRLQATGELIGVGGAQRQVTRAWNLLWRIGSEHQRQGLATELGAAALSAAHEADASVPMIAWIPGHNIASVAVAERLGLVNRGARTDPTDGVARLAFADRPLESRYGALEPVRGQSAPPDG